MEKNLKNIKKEFSEKGIFYTQPELAERLRAYLPEDVDEVYDPTCGAGNLLAVFDDDVIKYGQELDPEQLQIAIDNIPNFTGYAGDTLTDDGFEGKKFNYIIANYPFSIKWEPNGDDERFKDLPKLPPKSKADYAFIAHILHHLTDDGIASTLNFPGILYRGNAEQAIRKYLIEENVIDTIEQVEGGTFIDTSIATEIIVFKKNRTTTDVTFKVKGKERSVPISEIEASNYTLSPSTYVDTSPPKEEIDIKQLSASVRNEALRNIKASLTWELMTYKYFGDGDPEWLCNETIKECNKIIDDIKGDI